MPAPAKKPMKYFFAACAASALVVAVKVHTGWPEDALASAKTGLQPTSA
jgi:hypothetical protein